MTMSTDHFEAFTASVKALTLNNTTSTGIATDYHKAKETDLVAAKAIQQYVKDLEYLLELIAPGSDFLRDITVMTPSIVHKYFAKLEDWCFEGWALTTNGATCIGATENHLTLNPQLLINTGIGNYYIDVFVDNLPSGVIDVHLDGQWVRSLQRTGRHSFELIFPSAGSVLKFTYRDGAGSDQVVIKSLAIHYITTSFVGYLTAKIKQLATISAEDYVRKDELDHILRGLEEQFNKLLKALSTKVEEHLTADNPHDITCEKIGAATEDHRHKEYTTNASLPDKIRELGSEIFSTIDHKHDEYVTEEELEDRVDDIVSNSFAQITTLTPLTIVSAPIGKLPQRYTGTGVNTAAQIIQSPSVRLNYDVPYDPSVGFVDTDKVELIDEAAKFFSTTDEYAHIPDVAVKDIGFRISFHKRREILGYKLKHDDGSSVPREWTVYSDDSSFIHRALPHSAVFKNNCYTLHFDEPIQVESLTFILNDYKANDESTADLKVELLTKDMRDVLEITNEEFTICVPNSGANRIARILPSSVRTLPKTKIPGTEYYLYARKDTDESKSELFWSVFPPTCNDKRIGTDVLTDVFEQGATAVRSADEVECYSHAEYGTLILRQGKTIEGNLIDIYGSGQSPWTSEGSDVIIEHQFTTDNLLLTGYMLAWHNDVEDIPKAWTLTIIGEDSNRQKQTIVLDSIKEFYPFYSVEDDDLVYVKYFDRPITVRSIQLSCKARDAKTARITLSRICWFLSEYWYAPSSNTAHLGLAPVAAACIGSVYCNDEGQWEINNYYPGKCCCIPVNSLAECDPGYYRVPNPFHTESVTCTIRSHDFIQNSATSGIYITKVTAEFIELCCVMPARCSVHILRAW